MPFSPIKVSCFCGKSLINSSAAANLLDSKNSSSEAFLLAYKIFSLTELSKSITSWLTSEIDFLKNLNLQILCFDHQYKSHHFEGHKI